MDHQMCSTIHALLLQFRRPPLLLRHRRSRRVGSWPWAGVGGGGKAEDVLVGGGRWWRPAAGDVSRRPPSARGKKRTGRGRGRGGGRPGGPRRRRWLPSASRRGWLRRVGAVAVARWARKGSGGGGMHEGERNGRKKLGLRLCTNLKAYPTVRNLNDWWWDFQSTDI